MPRIHKYRLWWEAKNNHNQISFNYRLTNAKKNLGLHRVRIDLKGIVSVKNWTNFRMFLILLRSYIMSISMVHYFICISSFIYISSLVWAEGIFSSWQSLEAYPPVCRNHDGSEGIVQLQVEMTELDSCSPWLGIGSVVLPKLICLVMVIFFISIWWTFSRPWSDK